jgi:hypothetical protein
MKIYRGGQQINPETNMAENYIEVITADGIHRRLKPTGLYAGFDWGCYSKGSNEASLVIMLDIFEEGQALALAPQFKHDFINRLQRNRPICFELTEAEIKSWADIQLGKPVGVPASPMVETGRPVGDPAPSSHSAGDEYANR